MFNVLAKVHHSSTYTTHLKLRDIYALAQCSREMYHIFRPYLYHIHLPRCVALVQLMKVFAMLERLGWMSHVDYGATWIDLQRGDDRRMRVSWDHAEVSPIRIAQWLLCTVQSLLSAIPEKTRTISAVRFQFEDKSRVYRYSTTLKERLEIEDPQHSKLCHLLWPLMFTCCSVGIDCSIFIESYGVIVPYQTAYGLKYSKFPHGFGFRLHNSVTLMSHFRDFVGFNERTMPICRALQNGTDMTFEEFLSCFGCTRLDMYLTILSRYMCATGEDVVQVPSNEKEAIYHWMFTILDEQSPMIYKKDILTLNGYGEPVTIDTITLIVQLCGKLSLALDLIRPYLPADLNYRGDTGIEKSCLFYACESLNLPLVQLLVDNGADVNMIASTYGHTPIMECIWALVDENENDSSILDYLVSRGADTTFTMGHTEETILHAIVRSMTRRCVPFIPVLEWTLKHVNIADKRDLDGKTPLLFWVSCQSLGYAHLLTVELLLRYMTVEEINQPTGSLHKTALYYILTNNHTSVDVRIEACRLLINAGARINEDFHLTYVGGPPCSLLYTCSDNFRLSTFLLQQGADPMFCDAMLHATLYNNDGEFDHFIEYCTQKQMLSLQVGMHLIDHFEEYDIYYRLKMLPPHPALLKKLTTSPHLVQSPLLQDMYHWLRDVLV